MLKSVLSNLKRNEFTTLWLFLVIVQKIVRPSMTGENWFLHYWQYTLRKI